IVSLLVVGFGQPHVSSLLSVVASGVGFALFWVGLLRVEGRGRRFFISGAWFFGVQLIQLSWLASPTFQGTYIYFVYGALALWLGAQFALLSLLFPKEGPISCRKMFGIAGFWTLIEWGRLFVLCGFAWNPVGLSMTGFPVQGQLAAVFGVFGLSFIVIVVNLLAVNALLKPEKMRLLAWGSAFLFPFLFGGLHMMYHDGQKRGDVCHALLLQTALLPDQKDLCNGKEDRYVHPYLQWREIVKGIKTHVGRSYDLIVLPEYALPFSAHVPVYPLKEMERVIGADLQEAEALLKSPFAEKRGEEWYVSNAFVLQALANRYGAEIISGLDASEGEKSYNAAFHFIPEREEVFRYEKRILLPLAEYLPFSFLKPLVARYGIVNFFTPGEEAKVSRGKLPMSLSICYEECFPSLMREGRKAGAELFVNVTNDGWYPYSRLPEEHFIHGRVRAIENGVPLLRACNTGVTAGVDSLGRTVARFANKEGKFELEKGALFLSMNTYSYKTLYIFFGDGAILGLSLLCMLMVFVRKKNPLAEKLSLN
ncbi:MAG: apolipoprotein N-acyltransferase, partial [Chlamydiia bacterium]|nr:apolipoprotein N-acyltransferase [Chlamydiia bacterium]